MLNYIITGSNNPVLLEFTGVDLTQFTLVTATFKSDSRNTDDDPDSVIVNSATELELNFQDTTETGSGYWTITGVNALYPDGFVLTTRCLDDLTATNVI